MAVGRDRVAAVDEGLATSAGRKAEGRRHSCRRGGQGTISRGQQQGRGGVLMELTRALSEPPRGHCDEEGQLQGSRVVRVRPTRHTRHCDVERCICCVCVSF